MPIPAMNHAMPEPPPPLFSSAMMNISFFFTSSKLKGSVDFTGPAWKTAESGCDGNPARIQGFGASSRKRGKKTERTRLHSTLQISFCANLLVAQQNQTHTRLNLRKWRTF